MERRHLGLGYYVHRLGSGHCHGDRARLTLQTNAPTAPDIADRAGKSRPTSKTKPRYPRGFLFMVEHYSSIRRRSFLTRKILRAKRIACHQFDGVLVLV